MSMHRSLRATGQHQRTRNVLTREEQIEKLLEAEDWSEGDSVFGLPKVKVERVTPRRKPKEEEAEEEGEELEGTVAEEGLEAEAGAEEEE